MKKITVFCLSIWLIVAFLGYGLPVPGEVIQAQESDLWDGISAELYGLTVRNDVMTLKFRIKNGAEENQRVQFHYKDCYVMDESNQKKYFMLKDSDGQFIGGPKDKEWDGGRFSFIIDAGKSKGVWMKFPNPVDNPQSITVVIPGIMPFEAVAIPE